MKTLKVIFLCGFIFTLCGCGPTIYPGLKDSEPQATLIAGSGVQIGRLNEFKISASEFGQQKVIVPAGRVNVGLRLFETSSSSGIVGPTVASTHSVGQRIFIEAKGGCTYTITGEMNRTVTISGSEGGCNPVRFAYDLR